MILGFEGEAENVQTDSLVAAILRAIPQPTARDGGG